VGSAVRSGVGQWLKVLRQVYSDTELFHAYVKNKIQEK
jgi:hypothetical protein